MAQKTPWAVLLCKFRDNQLEPEQLPAPLRVPNFRRDCNRFFTAQDGSFNAVRFFSDMSHGTRDLSGSQVFGWYVLDVDVIDVVEPDPKPAGWAPKKGQGEMMSLAKLAATDAGVDLSEFFGTVLIMNVPTGWAQGGPFPGIAPTPGVAADCRRVNGQGRPGIRGGNGTEVFGQEMGHAFGLSHSRRDGSQDEYQDPWDIMSTAAITHSTPDPIYGARGPGMNAWNMRSLGWLDDSRVFRVSQADFDGVVELRPLHRVDLPGFLAAELPWEYGSSPYLVEFRMRRGWDEAIPRAAVLVHRFEGGSSYLMSSANGSQDLVAGDVFQSDVGVGPTPRVEILAIDEQGETAKVRLSNIVPNRFAIMSNAAPAAAGRSDTLFVFVKTLDGRILFNQAAPGAAFMAWQEVPGNQRTDVSPTAGMQANTLFVFAKSPDGRILFNQAAPGGAFVGWQEVPGHLTTDAPLAAAGRHDNLFVFAKAPDGRILFNQAAPGGAFVGWQEVPGGERTDAALGAGMQGNTLFVFAKRPDGHILFNQAAPGGAFIGWQM